MKIDDYRSKPSEYSVLEIPEYWIVDPLEQKVIVCTLDHRFYDLTKFRDEQQIQSPTFANLNLTAADILAAK